MASKLSELKEQAAALSTSERAELALALIESLDGPADSGVDEAWAAEIDRRLQEIDSGEVEPIPGDEVFRRLRERFG
jgi:putative addiction module component (TIGR02574 family)